MFFAELPQSSQGGGCRAVHLRSRCDYSCPPAPTLTKNHTEHLLTFSAGVRLNPFVSVCCSFKPCGTAVLRHGWSLPSSGLFFAGCGRWARPKSQQSSLLFSHLGRLQFCTLLTRRGRRSGGRPAPNDNHQPLGERAILREGCGEVASNHLGSHACD